MDFPTLLRATVPLGAALLAVIAVFAARRDRSASAPTPPRPRTPPVPARKTIAPAPVSLAAAPPELSSDRSPPRRPSSLLRGLAALGLLLLIAATALVFTISRPLADIDIDSARIEPPPCSASGPCNGPARVYASGTVAQPPTMDEPPAVRLLARPASSRTWHELAETQPDANGEWTLQGVPIPASAEPPIEVQAVVVPREPSTPLPSPVQPEPEALETPEASEVAQRASRVVRLKVSRGAKAVGPAGSEEAAGD